METQVLVSLLFSIAIFAYYGMMALSDYSKQKVYLNNAIENSWTWSFYALLFLLLVTSIFVTLRCNDTIAWLAPVIVALALVVKKLNYDFQRKTREHIAPTFSLTKNFELRDVEYVDPEDKRFVMGKVSFVGADYDCCVEVSSPEIYQKLSNAMKWGYPLNVKFERDVFYPHGINWVMLA